MHKPLVRLFLLICLAIPLAAFAQTTSTDESVQDVILDRKEAILNCPFKLKWSTNPPCNGDEEKIDIKTIAKDAERKGLTFYYLVTGGKIVGNGANVIWDFTSVRPGIYSVTVGVGKDGIIDGNFITKTIPLMECPICDRGCECAEISVSGPTAPAKRGETVIFTAHVVGGTQASVEYKWTVSSGTIVSGQGTPNILVKPDKDKRISEITATVEIGGLCELCLREASATVKLRDK